MVSPPPLLVWVELDGVSSRDDLLAQELNRPHDVLVGPIPLIAVEEQVARIEALDELPQLPGNGRRVAQDIEIDILELRIAQSLPKRPLRPHAGAVPPPVTSSPVGRCARGRRTPGDPAST